MITYRLTKNENLDQCLHCEGTGTVDVYCSWMGRDSVYCNYCFGSGYGLQGLIVKNILVVPEDVRAFTEAV